MTTELHPGPRRKDLTSRECVSILGGVLSGLSSVHGVPVAHRAVVFAASQPGWPLVVDDAARTASGFKKDAPVLAVLRGAHMGLSWNAAPGAATDALAWWAERSEGAWAMLLPTGGTL